MLTTTTTTDDDLSPIRKVVSIKNDSFDLINFNDSFNNSISTPSKHTMTKNPNDELDDLLEVTNSTNESEDFWLCEPKKLSTFQVCGKSTNKENLMNNNNKTDDHQSTINPYKWIMEDMDNKNLDKVKRTLLVTLDDISKGLVRRSRSVSNTRNPLLNYHGGNSTTISIITTEKNPGHGASEIDLSRNTTLFKLSSFKISGNTTLNNATTWDQDQNYT